MKQPTTQSKKTSATRPAMAETGAGLAHQPLPDAGQLRLLAVLLAAPEEGSLPLLEELAQAHAWLRAPAAELAALPLGDWQAEHTRLFVSGYPKTACPPFASAYRKGDAGGFTAEQLSALYQDLGLAADGVSADYLGTILECAAYLLERAPTPNDTHWHQLWHEHVLGWVPRFAQDLRAASHLLLYRGLAEQLLACLPDGP